jgi:hypothetical protein
MARKNRNVPLGSAVFFLWKPSRCAERSKFTTPRSGAEQQQPAAETREHSSQATVRASEPSPPSASTTTPDSQPPTSSASASGLLRRRLLHPAASTVGAAPSRLPFSTPPELLAVARPLVLLLLPGWRSARSGTFLL